MTKENKPKGRPKHEKYNISEMIKKIEKYTAESELPILKECCLENAWSYDYIMELKRNDKTLSQSIKRLLDKKEVILEKMMVFGTGNVTGCIFTLKQPAHGWSDKHDVRLDNDTTVNIILERE